MEKTTLILAATVVLAMGAGCTSRESKSGTSNAADSAAQTHVLRNLVVYRAAGRYGGWPANHGIWVWGNEILVGFESGWFKYDPNRHSIDREKPAEHMLARSLDGGETWNSWVPPEIAPPPASTVAGIPAKTGSKKPVDCPGGIDFSNPGFALTARMAGTDTGPSWFFYTNDRGKSWNGPYKLPNFGQRGIAARTDYLIDGKNTLTMFLTAAKSNGHEGRVICVRTEDGAKTWKFISYVCPEPEGDEYAIMPSSVRLPGGSILTAVRYRHHIALYQSDDNGATWRFLNNPAEDTGRGNPPSMVRLRDGRIVMTWGYRAKPFGIRARISEDEGKTWGNIIHLRDDGGAWDLGYTRTVQRTDGNLVTVYYFNNNDHEERYIGATIWSAGQPM